jgi:hypothetical protein
MAHYTLGHWVPFCRVSRLAGLRWRYSNPPPHGDLMGCVRLIFLFLGLLSRMALFVNPIWQRCPFMWHYPVTSPTIHRSWFLFNFSISFVLLPGKSLMSPLKEFSVCAALDRFLGNTHWDVASSFRSCERKLGSEFSQFLL